MRATAKLAAAVAIFAAIGATLIASNLDRSGRSGSAVAVGGSMNETLATRAEAEVDSFLEISQVWEDEATIELAQLEMETSGMIDRLDDRSGDRFSDLWQDADLMTDGAM